MAFPKTIMIQMTTERAIQELGGYDSDSEDEDSVPAVPFQQGQSRMEIEINSWDDMDDIPDGYEPVDLSEDEIEEYNMYLDNLD